MICGGKVTEPIYLEYVNAQVRAAGVTIEIAKSGKDPLSLVQEAMSRKRADRQAAKAEEDPRNVYDSVWVMFDVDEFAGQIPQAQKVAEENGILCALSNPCFEIWLLWHAAEGGAFLSSRQAQEKAQQCGVLLSAKQKKIHLPTLVGKYSEARIRAKRAEQTHREANRNFPHDNPKSDVHFLVDQILDGARRARPDETFQL